MPRNPLQVLKILRGAQLIRGDTQTVLFVTSLLRAREIKLASALRRIGWKVILIYIETTPFSPTGYFDLAIKAESEKQAHTYAKWLGPRICHVFSGAVDNLLLRFCRDKPAPVVIDMNDIFCPSLFDYCHERFEPTRECLESADGLCARDLQAKRAEKLDGYKLPRSILWFPEYSSEDGPNARDAVPKAQPDEVHVVSVGTFCLETQGMYDSGYLQLAKMLAAQRIHLHIYPHWFYRKSSGSVFNFDLKKDFADFFRLQEHTSYIHVHKSLPLDKLARELPQYDFGIVAGGSAALGQTLEKLKPAYMDSCYSGRIADYLDARLPILINPEVGFDFWLLKRYGVAVDLLGLLNPDFRESLLAIKHDRKRAIKVDRAARRLALDKNVGRLATFYKRVIEHVQIVRPRLGPLWLTAKKIPLIRRSIVDADRAIQKLNSTVAQLRNELDEFKNSGAPLEKLPVRQKAGTPPSIENTAPRLEIEWGNQWDDEVSGLLNWPEIRDKTEQASGMPALLAMIRLFEDKASASNKLSSCWDVLNYKHLNQLIRDGYQNFKRTIGCNYFNFLVQKGDPQIAYLESMLSREECRRCEDAARALADDPGFDWHDQAMYRYFVLLLWTYTRKVDVNQYLNSLEEPAEGNPLVVPYDGQRASQDLANSLLEYYSMREVVAFDQCKRVLEIGGGYGRDAYVILKLAPHVQYTLVDIPPALWVAQRYLSSMFRDRKIFCVRDFQNYEEVSDEMDEASIVCLLPHQLDLLPDRRFDLSLNISSFGEMQPGQIKIYLDSLARLTKGHFYMKQWKVSQNAFDRLSLEEADYPISGNWQRVYSRTCRVQTSFFETLYRVTRV